MDSVERMDRGMSTLNTVTALIHVEKVKPSVRESVDLSFARRSGTKQSVCPSGICPSPDELVHPYHDELMTEAC
jgi:hypothetical protein